MKRGNRVLIVQQGKVIAAVMAGALVVSGIAVVPAGATEQRRAAVAPKRAPSLRGPGAFTPSSADPRLAALFARGGLESRSFRFTPSETKTRAVTVAVRARSNRGAVVADRTEGATPATVGLAPIAYNLGVAVGWRRFAMTGDVAKVDLPGRPEGGRERAEVGVSYSLPRLTTRVRAGADRATGAGPSFVEGDRSYSLDVGGSYAVTRNLDVTAGVRYRSDRERIARVDDRRDSQAVYVGTAFRF